MWARLTDITAQAPVRHDIAMTGEIRIMGKVLSVGGIQAKLLAPTEAGVKTVILPAQLCRRHSVSAAQQACLERGSSR